MDSDDEDEETRAKRLATSISAEEVDGQALAGVSKNKEDGAPNDEPIVDQGAKEEEEQVAESEATQPAPKRAKTKPKSFLDEILADRSKKKGKKNKA